MSTIYLVRHGQASFGRGNYDRLSPRGIEQARILGAYLTRTGVRFDAVYCGDMERQQHTAQEIAAVYAAQGAALPERTVMPALNEYDSKAVIAALIGDLLQENPALAADLEQAYTSRKAFQRIFEPVMLRWVAGAHDKPGIETWAMVKARVSDALNRIMRENGRNKRVLVVASGGTISAAVQYALGIPDEATMRLCWQVVNTAVTRFMYNDERITLQAFNVFTHLELENDLNLVTYR